MRIDFLVADNRYVSAAHFTSGLSEAFERLGVKTRLFYLTAQNALKVFGELSQSPPDLTASFADITFGNHEPLAALWRIPHLSLIIDPAINFLHQATHPRSFLSCVDREDVRFLQKLGVKSPFFLPHAVAPEEICISNHPRPIDLLFLGTCIDIEAIESDWHKRYSKSKVELLYSLADKILKIPDLSILQALIEDDLSSEEIPAFHIELDLYTRGRDRIELLRSIEGVKVDVYGGQSGKWGWHHYLKGSSHCHIHPPVPFKEALALMRQAKMVLNSSIRFKHGSHERVLYAIASGALPLSSPSSYLKEVFPNLPTYIFGEVPPIAPLLKEASHFLKAAQNILKKRHTWDVNAQIIYRQFMLSSRT